MSNPVRIVSPIRMNGHFQRTIKHYILKLQKKEETSILLPIWYSNIYHYIFMYFIWMCIILATRHLLVKYALLHVYLVADHPWGSFVIWCCCSHKLSPLNLIFFYYFMRYIMYKGAKLAGAAGTHAPPPFYAPPQKFGAWYPPNI